MSKRGWYRVHRSSVSCTRCGGLSFSMGGGLMACEACGCWWWRKGHVYDE